MLRPLAPLALALTACGVPQPPEAAEPEDSARLVEALEQWNAAFDAVHAAHGEFADDGIDAAIVLLEGITAQTESLRAQMFPDGPESDVGHIEVPEPLEIFDPDFLAEVDAARALATGSLPEREGHSDEKWLEVVGARSKQLRLALEALDEMPSTVTLEFDPSAPSPDVDGGLDATIRARTDLQMRTIVDFGQSRLGELRMRRAKALEAEERLEQASMVVDAVADLEGVTADLEGAREAFLAVTENGDAEAHAKTANRFASGLHALRQAREVWTEHIALLEERGQRLEAALEGRPATRTVKSVDPRDVDSALDPLSGRPVLRRGGLEGREPAIAKRVAEAEDLLERWRTRALEQLDAVAAAETEVEIDDPWVAAARREVAWIERELIVAGKRLAELDAEEATTVEQLAAARAAYARAARAERAYDAARRVSARRAAESIGQD